MSRPHYVKQGLKELLYSGMQQRIEQLETIIENNKEYLELSKKEHALYEKLMMALPVSEIPTLMNYSDALNDIIVLQEKYFYAQGVRDCARLMLMASEEQLCTFETD